MNPSLDAGTQGDAGPNRPDAGLRACSVGPVPSELRQPPYDLDPFYQKHCDFHGLPIVSSSETDDQALQQAWLIVDALTARNRDAILRRMADARIRVAIMAATEVTTDIPEHSDLNEVFPDVDWDTRARGLGATRERPAVSGAEENLLCLPGDRYFNEDIFVHELAHTVHQFGLDSRFDDRLAQLFERSGRDRWRGLYAGTNHLEYWAEGTQSWFDVNAESDPPNGVHNHVNTRVELAVFDPGLHALLAEIYEPRTDPLGCH